MWESIKNKIIFHLALRTHLYSPTITAVMQQLHDNQLDLKVKQIKQYRAKTGNFSIFKRGKTYEDC